MSTTASSSRPSPNRRTFVDVLAALSDWIPAAFPAYCKIGTVVACTATISLLFGYHQGQQQERERVRLIEAAQEAEPFSRGWFRTSEVAEREAVSVRTVQLWCETGKIRAQKVGKSWRIPVDYTIADPADG